MVYQKLFGAIARLQRYGLAIVFLFSALPVYGSPPEQNNIDTLAHTVVRLFVTTSNGSRQGSGVIVSPDGVIFTAAHVVEDASEIRVDLFDGFDVPPVSTYSANLLYISPYEGFDFAILEITTNEQGAISSDSLNLPFAQTWSDNVVISEPIMIIGYMQSAGGVPHITSGIVGSTPEQPVSIGSTDQNRYVFYQTDAVMGAGDSGGLVINSRNEFIGIPLEWEQDQGGYVVTILPVGTICEIYRPACEYDLADDPIMFPPDPIQLDSNTTFVIGEEKANWAWICVADLDLTYPTQIRLYDWGTNPITGEDAGRVGQIVVIPSGSNLIFYLPWGGFCEPNDPEQIANRLPVYIDVLLNSTSYQQCDGQGSINCDSAEVIWLSTDGIILDRQIFRDPYP